MGRNTERWMGEGRIKETKGLIQWGDKSRRRRGGGEEEKGIKFEGGR